MYLANEMSNAALSEVFAKPPIWPNTFDGLVNLQNIDTIIVGNNNLLYSCIYLLGATNDYEINLFFSVSIKFRFTR